MGAREQHQSALIAKLKELRDAMPHSELHLKCAETELNLYHDAILCHRCKLDAIIKEAENE